MKKSKNPMSVVRKVTDVKINTWDENASIYFRHPSYDGIEFKLEFEKKVLKSHGWKVKEKVGLSERKKTYASKWLDTYRRELVEYFSEENEDTKFIMLLRAS